MPKKTTIERTEATRGEMVEAAQRTMLYDMEPSEALAVITSVASIEELVDFASKKLTYNMEETQAVKRLNDILGESFQRAEEQPEDGEAVFVAEKVTVQDDTEL